MSCCDACLSFLHWGVANNPVFHDARGAASKPSRDRRVANNPGPPSTHAGRVRRRGFFPASSTLREPRGLFCPAAAHSIKFYVFHCFSWVSTFQTGFFCRSTVSHSRNLVMIGISCSTLLCTRSFLTRPSASDGGCGSTLLDGGCRQLVHRSYDGPFLDVLHT